ncbi:nucleotidyl transferase [Halorubrum distributum JCM 9100]|uniref:Nucleotidyl transferase n=3 Tax=Halorubrum distributum TaxID=29283 RepID=M0ETQ4_9EURY|nr:nucleotidyl transferase [Halorubrum distributum JCM 9100]ELZ53039.1 nucleotidyl transferase [Halorubrum distributum JCM 10118]
MNDRTEDKPKCLVEVEDKTVLEHQIDTLEALDIPVEQIHVVIGTTGDCWTQESYERIRRIHDDIIINFENMSKGPAFSLRLGVEATTQDQIIILDGDVFVQQEILGSLIESNHRSAIVSKTAKNRGEPGSKVVTNNENVVTDIGKEIQPDRFPWHIYAGIAKIGGDELDALKETLGSENIVGMDVADVLREVSRSKMVSNIVFDDGWVNMNRPEDIKRAGELI